MRSMILTAVALGLIANPPLQASEYEGLETLSSHLLSGGPGKDGIPAMTNPLFVAPSEVSYVGEEELVLGVVINGEARAYPENLGWWHEIINDRIGDQSISVTLCPLTGTGLVFNATDLDGSQIEFGVSGLLINSNLVMYDRRDGSTLYPQMIYTGINGSFKDQQLELLPVVETTWAMWKKMHPATKVAQMGTGLDRYGERQRNNYNSLALFSTYPYGDYRTNHGDLFLFVQETATPDLSILRAKEVVLGLCLDGQAKAYPFRDLPDGAVVNDQVGSTPLVDSAREAGQHQQTWDGLDDQGKAVASGTYFYRLEMPELGLSQIRSLTLLR